MTLTPQIIYQGQTIMKWNTWKTLYFLIAIPLSLSIGIAINASPHRRAIVVLMMLLLAFRHHDYINSIPDTIKSYVLRILKNRRSPKKLDSSSHKKS